MRGITPVIAIILLLLITISIVGFSFLFFSRTTETATQSGEEQLGQQTQQFGTLFSVESAAGNKVYIRNRGTVPIKISSLAFYVNDVPVAATGPATLDPNVVSEYALDPGQLAAIPNANTLRVSGAATTTSLSDVCFTCGAGLPPPGFDFSLSNSGNIIVTQGNSASNTIIVTLVSGAAQSVTLSASGLPSGASAGFNPSSGSPAFTSALTVSTLSATPAGDYAITVTGIGGGLTRTTSFTLTVNAPGGGTTGLVGYWKFDEGTGTTTADATGNSSAGDLVNGAGWANQPKFGNAVQFDGTDDFVNLTNSSATNFRAPLSVMLWVNTSVTNQDERYLVGKRAAFNTQGWEIQGRWTDIGSIRFISCRTGGNCDYFDSNGGANWTNGQWHHLALTFDGATTKWYQDGRQIGTQTFGTNNYTLDGDIPLTIGRRSGSSNNCCFKGAVDDFKLFNRILTLEEIKAEYEK